MKKLLQKKFIVVTTFLLLSSLAIGYISSNLYLANEKLNNEKQMSLIAVNMANHIKTQINDMSTVTNILASLLKNSNYEPSKFEQWAKELQSKFPNIENIQFAKNGIVSHIYPLQGHEGAMGHDLLKDKKRVKGASIAINTKTLTFVGPLKLIQNNQLAIIGRLPIFDTRNDEEVFWGFSTVIVYLIPLLEEGLKEVKKAGFDYRLEGKNLDIAKRPLFISSIEKISQESNEFHIKVPNGSWIMTLQPKELSKSYLLEFELFFLFMGCLFSVLFIKYEKKLNLILRYQNKIEEQEIHKSYLEKSNAKLKELSFALENEKTKYKNLLLQASDGVFILNLEGKLLEFSEKAKTMLGYSQEEMEQLSIFDWDPTISKEMNNELIANLKSHPISLETKHKRKDGSFYDALISANKIDQNDETVIYCTARDISKEKQLEAKLLEERNFAQLLVENTTMIVLTDSKTTLYANKALLDFFACKSIESFQKRYKCVCYEFLQSEYYFHLGMLKDKDDWVVQILSLPEDKRVISMISKTTYEERVFSLDITYLDNRYLISFNDISNRVQKQLKLEKQVFHDTLTGAYSREYFLSNIHNIIYKNEIINKRLALVMIDIDYFKKVNDSYGHDVGDEVLKTLVQTIQQNSRIDDILIRWGGEEFILILAISNEETLFNILENLRITIQETKIKTVQQVTCSFGAALYNSDENIKETIKRADKALYESKNSGRNQVSIYK